MQLQQKIKSSLDKKDLLPSPLQRSQAKHQLKIKERRPKLLQKQKPQNLQRFIKKRKRSLLKSIFQRLKK
jgi:hypothetical protein